MSAPEGLISGGGRAGRPCIGNTGAVVEHDVVLGTFTHVPAKSRPPWEDRQ